jgi:DNA-binding NtrC family response regulator
LTVWLEAEFRPLGDASEDAASASADNESSAAGTATTARIEPPSAPADDAATLAQLSRQLIEQTLAACGGNVSQAARRLGVSRGLLYRRLRQR